MIRNTIYLATLSLIVTLTAACAGGGQNPAASSLPAGSAGMQSLNPQDNRGCQDDGNVSVMPCFIKFTSSNPGPVSVTVRTSGDGNRQRIRERDDCATQNIATITRVSNGHYTVAAGTAVGKCDAEFSTGDLRNDDGSGGGGNGNLHIVNKI